MARELDTSRARCDVCGKLYQPGDGVYSLADKFDEDIEDRDVLVSFRHWDCHTPVDQQIKNIKRDVDAAGKRVLDALDKLRRHL